MANRIKGITMEIGGDTTKLQTALKGMNTEIRGTQSQLRDVEKLLKLDPGNTELLAQRHRLLGEAVEAMNYMAMAGWKTSDMLSGIEGIMNLAAVSGEDLAATSDIVTDALTAFGLSAVDSGHFADILAAASSNANTNVSMMGETFKYCAPIAGALGFSAEDTAATTNADGSMRDLSDMPQDFGFYPDLDVTEGANFYQALESKIETILNASSRGLSVAQKEHWRSMAGKVDTPLQYGYYEGWEIIISSFELLMFSILAICIVIAPVFSGEYQAGTDAVILSGKYGKTKLITAKIIASFVFGTIAFALHIAVAWGLPLAVFDVDGWNLPLQIAGTTIPYPFTFLQAALINIGIVYLVLLAMVGLTLLLSSKMKSPYLVLIVLVPVLFIPLFLSPN